MNKVLFNNGGQPVYLDDLETIQGVASDVLPGVLKQLVRSAIPAYGFWTSGAVLGNLVPFGSVSPGAKGFFITPYCTISRNDDTKKAVLDFWEGGYVCIGEELLEYAATKIEVDYGSPFYVIVKKDYENRTLDNGEVAACKEHKYAVISKDASESDCYSSADLCSLADAMYNIVFARRGVVLENSWKKLNVYFLNGYSGTVEYRETTDSYRYRINISSTDTNNKTGNIDLFDTTESGWPGGYRNSVSCLFGSGGDDESETCILRFSQERIAYLSPVDSNRTPAVWTPFNCQVKTIFEIPK